MDTVGNTEDYLEQRRNEIAGRIREARSKRKWTQEQAAQYLGFSLSKYNRVERGGAELTLLEAERLSNAFGGPVTYFFRRLAEYNETNP